MLVSDRLRQLPNALSGLRLALALPVAWAIVERAIPAALLLLVAACATDVLDGWLARRHGWRTQFGAFLDPAADKILMGTAFLALACTGHVAVWLAVLVIGRDLLIAAGALVYRLLRGPFQHAATRLGKASTLVQMVLVVVVVAELDLAPPLAAYARALAALLTALVVIVTVCSGVDYVWTWGRRAVREATDAPRGTAG